jgi:hypothetical protein
MSAASALPHWTPVEDSTVVTAVWGGGALDETSIALLSASNGSPIDGNYSVNLYAFADAPLNLYKTASISQTGDVPANARSIQFLMRPYPPNVVQATPLVTLNGTVINVFPISTNGAVFTMGGDITAFAGTTAQLTIKVAGTPGGAFPYYVENYFDLDDISFSPTPVPEPSSALLAIEFSAVVAVWRSGHKFLRSKTDAKLI